MSDQNFIEDAAEAALLGLVLWGGVKLLFFVYMLFAATFWALLRWLAVTLGISLLRTYNLTRRLFS